MRKDNEFIRLLAIVYGIESGYSADAISPAGACGIGQMLLSTAKEAARELGDPVPTHKSLLEIETNIRLSSHFMGQLLDRFGNNQAAALIAYNAGPSWVSRFKRSGRLPAETTAYLSRYFYLQQEYCK